MTPCTPSQECGAFRRLERRLRFASAALLLLVAGCGPGGRLQNQARDRLIQEILVEDPEFAWVLERHRTTANQIETYQRELALKRATVEQNVAELRRDLAATTAQVRSKIAEAQQRVEPDRATLKMQIVQAETELRGKRLQRSQLGRTTASVRKGLHAAGGAPSAERSMRETQQQELARDAQRLDQELTGLKAHLRLLRIKLELIRL